MDWIGVMLDQGANLPSRPAHQRRAISAALGGLDALVFTGGIGGEHSARMRTEICNRLEREVISVANLTREDARTFFTETVGMNILASVTPYSLERANEALADLRDGRLNGAAVLVP